MRQSWYHVFWFTLTELLVSITISVLVLGWVFYFISETLLGLARTSSQSEFLKSFYNFTSVLESGDFEILSDDGYDVGLIESLNTGDGIILGVVNSSTLRLIPASESQLYLPSMIAYRQVSAAEILAIRADPSSIFWLQFERAGVFNDFFVDWFELTAYNSAEVHELELQIFPLYYESLSWLLKTEIEIEDIHSYSLIF